MQQIVDDDTNANTESQLNCNNGLLEDYCIYFSRDFDQCLEKEEKNENTQDHTISTTPALNDKINNNSNN